MNVVPISREWMKIWSGTIKGHAETRWFVEHCSADAKMIVADFATEEEAASARGWDLPLLRNTDR